MRPPLFLHFSLLLIALTSAIALPVQADDLPDHALAPDAPLTATPDAAGTEKKGSLFDRWFDSFVNIHDQTSQHYLSMVRSIDRYFSGEKIEDTSNGSYIKLDLKNTFYKAGDQDNGISINTKLELPNTEKHLKFIFNTNPDEAKTLEQRVVDNAAGQRIQKESSIAGVEYSSEPTTQQWQHNFSAGVKLRISPIPFMRYQFGKKWQLDESWSSEFKQSFWDYRDDGLGSTTRIDFGRPLTSKDYLKIETQAEYRDHDTRYYFAQTVTNTHLLTPSSAISYWVGALGQSQPSSDVTAYLLGLQYRRSLYRDWLLFSVNPLLTFPRVDNWKVSPSLTLNLQIYFTE